jgi:hypothetical protein
MQVGAILGKNNSTTNPVALKSFNAARERAGMPTVKKVTKHMLLHERRVEFAFEDQRWFDLQRFGVADSVLSAFAKKQNFSFSKNDLLLPIPQREIDVSKGQLTQNPGYH